MSNFANTANASHAQAGKGEHEKFIAAWLDQVRCNRKLPFSAFHLAYEIAIHLNRKRREAWPNQDTIGAEAKLSKNTIKKLIQLLVDAGHLDFVAGTHRGHPSRYRPILKNAERGQHTDPFANAGKGSRQDEKGVKNDEKGVKNDQERGQHVDPDLIDLKDLGEANASPKGRERNASLREGDPSVTAAPDGAATGFEESKQTTEGFRELRRLWDRGWLDTDTANAAKAYLHAIRNTDPATIMAAAQAWVENCDAKRFLPTLANWLSNRGWEKPPPAKRERPAKTPEGRAKGYRKTNFSNIALEAGGYVQQEDGSWLHPDGDRITAGGSR